MIKIGSIVKCINDDFKRGDVIRIGKHAFPEKGKLYTVIAIKEQSRGIGLFLEEIDQEINVIYSSFERIERMSFLSSRFELQANVNIQKELITKVEFI